MAIFHLAATVIKRSEGRSATAAAAYRSGSRIQDFRTGAVHDYSRRRGIFGSEILVPPSAPTWASNREALWNAVEFGERRKDAQVSREMNLALPRELGHAEQKDLMRRFVAETFVAAGMIADIAWHELDSGNPHAHVMLTMREVTPTGFGNKNRAWDAVERLREWRTLWASFVNIALESAGRVARVDHRSLAEQGASELPAVHIGPKWTALNRERPATPMHERDQRSQANAAIAVLNGRREARWAVEPAKAARSAATHYERLASLWHRSHRRSQLESRALRPVPTIDDLVERMAEYMRRRKAIEAAAERAVATAHQARDLADVAPMVRDPRVHQRVAEAAEQATRSSGEVEDLRGDMRLWVDDMRTRLTAVVVRVRGRQRDAVEALQALGRIEAQAEQWREQIRDDIPAYLDKRRRPRIG
ncbi:MAG: MobQ family relaxase [Dokdonella sp.]